MVTKRRLKLILEGNGYVRIMVGRKLKRNIKNTYFYRFFNVGDCFIIKHDGTNLRIKLKHFCHPS